MRGALNACAFAAESLITFPSNTPLFIANVLTATAYAFAAYNLVSPTSDATTAPT